MTDTEKVAALLREAEPAHGQAFIETDGEDPDWPLWYAGYLQESLSEALGVTLTKSELVYQLVDLEKARNIEAPDAEWPDFYAEALVERAEASDLGI